MVRKVRDFEHLTAGLVSLTEKKAGQPQADVTTTKQKPGRPATDTKALQLRLPRQLLQSLVQEAAAAAVERGSNVTPQQIIIKILEERYNG